jgi:hypothetical protein
MSCLFQDGAKIILILSSTNFYSTILGAGLKFVIKKRSWLNFRTKTPDSYRRGLIHHSDRGTQYCCKEYVKILNPHCSLRRSKLPIFSRVICSLLILVDYLMSYTEEKLTRFNYYN